MVNVKVSAITVSDIANYIRLDEVTADDRDFIEKCLEIAKSYIKNYTGVADLDTQADFVIVVYVLCQDMYDTRTLYIEKNNVNKVVESILNMHCKNLI